MTLTFILALNAIFALPLLLGFYPAILSFVLSAIIVFHFVAYSYIKGLSFGAKKRSLQIIFLILFLIVLTLLSTTKRWSVDLVFLLICLFAFMAGSRIGVIGRNLSHSLIGLMVPILIYSVFFASEYNSEVGAIRSNYIGIGLITYGSFVILVNNNVNKLFFYLCVLLVVLTFTRSVILGLLIGFILSTVRSDTKSVVLFFFAVVFANLSVVFFEILPEVQRIIISEYFSSLTGKAFESGRTSLWIDSLNSLTLRNILIGNILSVDDPYVIDPSGLHNGFLYVFIKFGLLGVLINLYVFLRIFVNARGYGNKLLQVGIVSLMIKEAFEISIFSGNLLFAVYFWLIVGAVLSCNEKRV